MTIKRLPNRERWLEDCLAAKMGERREGRHLTDSVMCNIKGFGAARMLTAGHEPPRPNTGTIIRMAIGVGLGDVIEQGHMAQMQAISDKDDSVGTIDIWWRGRVVEIKATWQSSGKSPEDNAHWMEQTGGYAARQLGDAASVSAEFWIFHLGGDGGAMYCPAHGRSEGKPPSRLYEPTGKKRMYCPECQEFLVPGNREPEIRCWSKTWPAEELRSLHAIQTERLAQLDTDIKNPRYQLSGELPPIRWGFQSDFECKGCIYKDAIGCPGIEGGENLESQLKGSIFNIQTEKEKATA